MDINISTNLRDLRRERGNTQEDLANFLSISIQAVSKWERGEGYPDIILLPKIAAFYNVSVDDLLGVGEIRKRERIDRYFAESRKLQNVGKVPEAVALWREALKEFPNDHTVISELAHALFYQNSSDRERFKEVIELEERILRESTNQGLRDRAVQLLCYSYNNLDDYEKAKEYAETASSIDCSNQLLLSNILKDDESDIFNKELITVLADYIGLCTYHLNSVPWEKRHEFYLKIIEMIFDDGFYGFYSTCAAERHHFLARIYADRENQEEKVRYHIEQLVRFAKQYDSLDGEYTYTSTFMKGVKGNSKEVSTNVEGTECEQYLKALTDEDSRMFDKYRGEGWFKEAMEGLRG